MVSQRRFEGAPFGVMRAVVRKVRKAPRRKEEREMRVEDQAWGFAGRSAVERPRMTVLPGESWSAGALGAKQRERWRVSAKKGGRCE